MTPDPRPAPPTMIPRWAAEILGLALIVVGLTGLVGLACTVSARLGIAVLCVAGIAAGIALTTSSEEPT